MIKKEYLDGGLIKTYSDIGMYVHGGWPEADYAEAIDPASMNRTYIETDRPIEDWSEPEEMVSSKNIPSGQYFTVGNHLLYSTATIPAGEDIIIGTNAVETTIADELNNIKESE